MNDSTSSSQKPTSRRPLVFIIPGILFLCAAALLFYDRTHVHTTIAPMPQPYTYNVQQSVNNKVHYRQSSFFGDAPDPTNTAYIANLTDYITAQFHYAFKGSETTKISYQYSAVATVRATYGNQASEGGIANVWTKQFELIKPTSGSTTGNSLALDPSIQIPFSDYKQAMDQFKDAITAPLTGEMAVTYTVHVSGKVNGAPFTDTKVSSITTSLDQQVYQLAVKYDKTDHKQIFPVKSQHLADTITQYETRMAILLVVLGGGCLIYAFRRQIFKSPYARELERIYRYHDGIIIRAKKTPNVIGKNVVPVQSFDDLLNLEEEIKAPILASQVGDTATQFIITKDDIVYVYTLGEITADESAPIPISPQSPPKIRPEKRLKVSG